MQLLSSLDETTDFSDTEGSATSDVEDAVDVSSDECDSEDSPMPPAGRIQERAVAQKSDPKKNLIAVGLMSYALVPRPRLTPNASNKNQMHSIVNSDMNFRGAVCFYKTYQSVPNPALRLEGPGHVGLPVNSRDVCAIKEHSKAMKSGPRVTVNAEDAWEMEPSRVAFDNPAWSGFLNSIVEDVCKALAIEFISSKPRCELQKLLLQGQSSVLPLAQQKPPNIAFATLIITLPCTFKGGEAVIAHAGRSTRVDQSRDSFLNTCAMAWYNGLTPTFERITAGHRLVLHYQLIHTTNSPSPALPSPSRAIDRLGKVLASWKKSVSGQDAPRKIVYLLDHKYSEATLTADGLKGRDAYILSVLKNVAQTEGFKLLLAHLELFAQGEASCGSRQKWGSRQYCHSDNDSDREETKGADPSRLKFQDPSDVEHELELSKLRTLDGTPVKDRIGLLEMLFPTEMKAVESIPGDLKATLERGKPDSVHYDEPESNWMGGTLCRWFRRSVLIICPTEHYSPFIHGIVSPKDALDTLRSSSSTSPTEQETSLVDCVLSAPGEYSKEELEDALRVVTACACRWGDFELWHRAMDVGQGWKGIYRVQSSGLLSALLSLPFDSVSQSVLRVITNDRTRSKRLSFAYEACQELKPAGLSTTWILEALKADIKSIGSLKPSELDLLVMITLSAGGIPGFEKHILTELKSGSNPRCSTTIAYRLQQELDKSEEFSREERSRAKRAVNDLLSNAATDWEPYWIELEQPNPLFLLGRAAVRQPSADVPIQLIKAAVESNNVALIETLTLKLTDVPERGDQVEVSPEEAVRLVAFPTLKEIVKYLQDNPPEKSLSNLIRQLKRGLSQVVLEHGGPHRHDLPVIFQAAEEELDADYLQNGLVPQFCKLHHNFSAYETFCQQLGVWKNKSSDSELRETIDNSIKHLLRTATSNDQSQYTHSLLLVDGVLKLCAQVGVVDFCSYIFSRLAEQAATLVARQHPHSQVISYLGTIRQWLSEEGHGPLYPSFPELARAIVSAWRQTALGPMPAGVTSLFSAINGVTCGCQHCVQVKSYLRVLNPYEKRLDQIGLVDINHVVETTLPHCGTVVRWRPIQSKPEPSLWMRKSDETIQSLIWLGKKRSGLEALQKLSEDEATLKQVLGEDEYRRVLVALRVDYINAPLPAVQVQQAESSLSVASASTRRSSASAGNERPAKRRKTTTT